MAVKKDRTFSFHITQDRERKNLAILELIRKKGPISRADISRELGLNIVTITNYIDYYIDKRMILEMGLDVSSGGRRPELLELNAKSGYVIGVDMGPDFISAVVADLKINVVARAGQERPRGKMEDMISTVISIIEEALKNSKISKSDIKNIGIGMSGIVDYLSGTIRDTDPTRGRTKVSFLKFTAEIEKRFDIPVYIGNDASCAAFGEKTLNPGADIDNMIYCYSDVGCGMIIHGDVYIGSSGCAGETQLAFDGLQKDEKSYAKEYTHLRPWGVDLGVVFEAKRVIEKGLSTDMLGLVKGDVKLITKEVVIEAAKKNDKPALELIENAGRNLGIRIAYIVNLCNPAVVIIGGGMEKAGDLILDPIKATVRKFSFEEPAGAVKIIPSLLGDSSVVLGAAALAAREVFIQA